MSIMSSPNSPANSKIGNKVIEEEKPRMNFKELRKIKIDEVIVEHLKNPKLCI